MGKENIYIGTSGWYYEHWNEAFYPEKMADKKRLPFYANQFSTVEVNTTFYHLPRLSTVENWHDSTPKEFIFSVKASRFITHFKRLQDPQESLEKFFSCISPLKEKLGPILFQLPPSYHLDFETLEQFIQKLTKDHLITFEFRHSSWFCDEVYDLLKRNKIALCISHLKGKLSPLVITAPFVYMRLHGPKSSAYSGSYSSAQIRKWKDRIESWSQSHLDVYCYFDNDEKGYAINDALRLKRLLNQ